MIALRHLLLFPLPPTYKSKPFLSRAIGAFRGTLIVSQCSMSRTETTSSFRNECAVEAPRNTRFTAVASLIDSGTICLNTSFFRFVAVWTPQILCSRWVPGFNWRRTLSSLAIAPSPSEATTRWRRNALAGSWNCIDTLSKHE